MVFFCGICLFPEKMTLFFFCPQQIAAYSCPVPSGVLSNNRVSSKVYQFYYTRTPGSLENEPVAIAGKIIWAKNKSPVRITFLCKTGQQMATSWRHDKKEHLFYKTSPSDYF